MDRLRAICRTYSVEMSAAVGYLCRILRYSYCSIWGSSLLRPAPYFLSMPFSAHLLMFLMGTPYYWLSLLIEAELDL